MIKEMGFLLNETVLNQQMQQQRQQQPKKNEKKIITGGNKRLKLIRLLTYSSNVTEMNGYIDPHN